MIYTKLALLHRQIIHLGVLSPADRSPAIFGTASLHFYASTGNIAYLVRKLEQKICLVSSGYSRLTFANSG